MTFDSIRFAGSTAASWGSTSERCTKHAQKTARSTIRTERHKQLQPIGFGGGSTRALYKYKQEHEAVQHLITHDALDRNARATNLCVDTLLNLAAMKSCGSLQQTTSNLFCLFFKVAREDTRPLMTG